MGGASEAGEAYYLPLKFGTIEQKVFFEGASPEELYDALLDAEKHSAFTGSPATTRAKKGATFTAWDGYITGRNLELVKPRKIVQEWSTTEWPDGYPPSRLELTLTAKNGGTELKMLHSKVPAEQVADYTEGWHSSYWEPLRAYLAVNWGAGGAGAEGSKKRRAARSPKIPNSALNHGAAAKNRVDEARKAQSSGR